VDRTLDGKLIECAEFKGLHNCGESKA
jgi:hypothetical protein